MYTRGMRNVANCNQRWHISEWMRNVANVTNGNSGTIGT